MSAVKIKGVPVRFGDGTTLIVPPVPLGFLEANEDGLKNPTPGIMIDTIHRALIRNYPQITREQVGELLDMSNAPRCFQAALAQIPASDDTSGEAPAP